MAAIAKKLSLSFFLLLTLSSSLHARESQFFAKLSNNNPKESQPFNTNQQDPKFIPQAQEDGGSYGLYGHESGQLPPSTTTTTANNGNLPANLPENYNPVAYTTPIHSNTQDLPDEYSTEPQAFRYDGDSSMYNNRKQDRFADNGENIYSSEKQETGTNGGNMYNSQKQQGMSDTRFLENGRYYYPGKDTYNPQKLAVDETESEEGGNMYNTQKQEMSDTRFMENGRYNPQKQGMGETMFMDRGYSTTSNGGRGYNTEKQGMSDTRFLEGGKYYHDINMENLNANANVKSRGFDSRNGYHTKGYYGNNDNSYDTYNSNGGYQNPEEYPEDQFNP